MNSSNGTTFRELLQASFKSNDTEEWLDVHFTRPIGLVFALFWNRFGVHPNVITILSIFLGIAAGYMFVFTDLWHNLAGVVLLMFANFCDSTDGQMARLTGKKTLIGRMLDGFSGDVWFFCIYAAFAYRLMDETIPFTDCTWGLLSWVLAVVAGLICHSPQSSLSDYYRQIHLFFLKGKEGSELDNYAQQRAIYESLPKSQLLARTFYFNYSNYCKSQEKRTPVFQKFFAAVCSTYKGDEDMPGGLRQEFRGTSLDNPELSSGIQYGIGGGSGTTMYPESDFSNSSIISGGTIEIPYRPHLTVADLTQKDGSIGTVSIKRIGLSAKVYEGATDASMAKGAGHYTGSGLYDGNIGLFGHNRGSHAYFAKLKNAKVGDTVTYTTNQGIRTYEVTFVGTIGSTDYSYLNEMGDNRITMITCIANQPSLRLCVQAVEI